MTLDLRINTNLTREETYQVIEPLIAKFLDNEGISILSTPSMISLMEQNCRLAADSQLPPTFTTVGTHVNIKHLAAVPKGETIIVKIALKTQDRRRLTFTVETWWKETLVGNGIHVRFIVNKADFLSKLKSASK